MQASRPHRQYAPALSHELGRFLDVATILAAQGLSLQRRRGPEWVASFPEAALLRGTCRAAYGDRALLGLVARMRLGRSGVTLVHRAAYVGNWVALKEALLYAAGDKLNFDIARVDVGSIPRHSEAARLTPLAMALDGAHGSSLDCVELLLALGASPERALEGLVSSRHYVSCGRPRALDVELISHVLELASPDSSLWTAWDVGLMLRHPGITAAATQQLVEEFQEELEEGESYDRIVWDLDQFSHRYGAEHYELLRALGTHLPPYFFSDVLQAYVSIEDNEALAAALGSDLAMLPEHRATALWAAAASGMLERVQGFLDPAVQILALHGLPYNLRTTPLTAAVANEHLEIVKYLVMHQTPEQGTYAEKLQASVQVGLAALVQGLLSDHGGEIGLEAEMNDDDDEILPRYILVLACAEGRQDIVEMLVDAGASVHVGMDSVKDAPLISSAAGHGEYCTESVTAEARVALVKYLIQKGALHTAAQWAAFAAGQAHLHGLESCDWLDECKVIQRAVAELAVG